MTWADIPDDEVLLRVQVPAGTALTGLRAVAWDDEDEALDHDTGAIEASADLPVDGTVRSGAWWSWTKAALDGLAPEGHPWILLHLAFGGRSHWAVVRWVPATGFELVLRSWNLDGLAVAVVPASTPARMPLSLVASAVDPNPERLFAIGNGGDSKRFRYDHQARTYLLMREFDDSFVWASGKADERVYPDLVATTRWDDGAIATMIHKLKRYGDGNAWKTDRATFTRLFPPGRSGPVSRENLASRRAWGQWYPVHRVQRRDDPISTDENAVKRAWAYLRHVATAAPGRVVEMIVISHAIVLGPTGFGTNNVPAVFATADMPALLPAFAEGATFWVTGCNSNTTAPGGTDALVPRQSVTVVEGTVRAFLRLTTGLEALVGQLRVLATAPESETHQAARAQARALFDAHPDHRDHYRWQIPGPAEGILATADATWRGRDGSAVRRIYGFDRRATTLRDWAALDDPTEAQTLDAVAAAEWIASEVTWDVLLGRTLGSQTLSAWIEAGRQVVSADVHYVAAFAHFAAKHGRADLHALGGNPGLDGIHLAVTLELVDEDGATATYTRREISAYTRSESYSRHNRPWLLSFYARFGLCEAHPLGYADYQGVLDATGQVKDPRPGVQTDRGFDRATLHPWPRTP